MISNSEKLIFLCPCRDGSLSKPFSKGYHWGVDFGWTENKNCDILAIQDGKVVDNFYSDSCGYSIVLQHDYQDGSHRWSAYIHLNNRSDKSIGAKVSQGDKIGVKGNTGNSNGYHLHIGVSDSTTKVYSWNTLKALCNYDPAPHFYKWKNVEYIGEWYTTRKYIEDYQIKYPYPVDRDTTKKQVQVLIDYLYLRDEPNGTAYPQFCTKGIYNVLEEKVAGSYNWYKIADSFYIASGGARTKDLPAETSKEQQLQDEIDKLKTELETVVNENIETKSKLDSANEKINSIISILNK